MPPVIEKFKNIFKNEKKKKNDSHSHQKFQEKTVQERKDDYTVLLGSAVNIYIVIISILIVGFQLLEPTYRQSWEDRIMISEQM